MKKMSYFLNVPKTQFKMYLEKEWVDRLTDAGGKFGRGSPQSVVEEILNLYFPVWASVNLSLQKAIDQQSQRPNGAPTFTLDVGNKPNKGKKANTG